MEEFERVACVKNEVFVFKIPPRSSNRGYRAADWTLDKPDWTGRLRVVTKGKELTIKLEDKSSGELFALAPIDGYPGMALEAVTDSSRYFVLQIKDPSGRKAFIGIGFTDRGDSFDLNVALQDHFKWIKQEKDIEKSNQDFFTDGPKLDLGFKAGQTISINLGGKKEGGVRSRPRPTGQGGEGIAPLLPPPPGGGRIARPPPGPSPQHTATAPQAAAPLNSAPPQEGPEPDLFGGLSAASAPAPLGGLSAAPAPFGGLSAAPAAAPFGGLSAVPAPNPISGATSAGASNIDLLMDLDPFATPGQQP